jgi:hypothetical protein
MAVALDHTSSRPQVAVEVTTGWLGVAGLTSLGAGAIHAAAIGVHAEHRQAALTFMLLATLQLCWGGLALVRSGRLIALAGGVLGLGSFAGWAMAKSSGISFISGLDVAEPVQTADALAAGLAVASVLLALVSLRALTLRAPTVLAALGVTGVTMFGMAAAGTHVHAHDAAAHAHVVASGPVQAVAPTPYDPAKPIDLSGVPGVTPEQQAAAENIVAVTLVRLPKWSDPAVAEAAGFRSIGDGFTGVEHFVNQAFMDDDTTLDPDRPESLVFDTSGGGRRLVAAMYMLKRGTPLAAAPNIGGALMQWHTHENLCYTAGGKVAGITDAKGNCPRGLFKPEPTPMIHVWIEAHKCGPFAALEGIGGGRVPDGETVLCDHAHGA